MNIYSNSKTDALEQTAQYVAGGSMVMGLASVAAGKVVSTAAALNPSFAREAVALLAKRIGTASRMPFLGGLATAAMGVIAYKTAGRMIRGDADVNYVRDGSLVAGSVLGGLTLVAHRLHADIRFKMVLGALAMAVNLADAVYSLVRWKEGKQTAGEALFQAAMVGLFTFNKTGREQFEVFWRNRPVARMQRLAAIEAGVQAKIKAVTQPFDEKIASLHAQKNGDAALNAELDRQIAVEQQEQTRAIHRLRFELSNVEIPPDPTWEGDAILRADPSVKRFYMPSLGRVVYAHEDHVKYLLVGANGTGGVPLPKEIRGFALLGHGAGASFSSSECFVADGKFGFYHSQGVIAVAMDHPYHLYGPYDRKYNDPDTYFASIRGAYDRLATRFGTKGVIDGRSFGANEGIELAYRYPDLPMVVAMSPYAVGPGESWVGYNFGKFSKWMLLDQSSLNTRGFLWSMRMDRGMGVFTHPERFVGRPHAPIRLMAGGVDREYPLGGPGRHWPKWVQGRGDVKLHFHPEAGHDHFLSQDSSKKAKETAEGFLAGVLDDVLPWHPAEELRRAEAAIGRFANRESGAAKVAGQLTKAQRDGNDGQAAKLLARLNELAFSGPEADRLAALRRRAEELRSHLAAAPATPSAVAEAAGISTAAD